MENRDYGFPRRLRRLGMTGIIALPVILSERSERENPFSFGDGGITDSHGRQAALGMTR